MQNSIAFFERLLNEQRARPADKRLVWIRGFRSALDVSGCLQMDLRRRVAQAEEQALDDAVGALSVPAERLRVTEGIPS